MAVYVVTLSGITEVIDHYESLIWNNQYYGQGDFEMILPMTRKSISQTEEGTMLVRDTDVGVDTYKNVMICQTQQFEFDPEKGWMLTVKGKSLKSILSRRIVWSQTNFDDVTVENAIYTVLAGNAISPSDPNRAIPNLFRTASKGYTEKLTQQLFGDNVAEWIEEVCTTYGYGWEIYIQSGMYVFNLFKGADRTTGQSSVMPVVFSQSFDNLLSCSYSINMEEFKNAALVGGEGEGTSQRSATVGAASGLDRYEAYIDGGSVSSNGEIITLQTYLKMLEEYGTQQLTEKQYNQKAEGKVSDRMYKLGRDYFLGDLVEVDLVFTKAETRVIEIIYSEDETGITISPTFSEWSISS